MNNKYTYQELETKFGPHTAELQRRFDYRVKYFGLLDQKFCIDDESVAQAKKEGKTTEELVEEIAKESIRMEEAETIAPDKDFF